MAFLTAFGLAIIIAFIDLLFLWVIWFCGSSGKEIDEFFLFAGMINTFFFVLTLTFTICKLKLGII